MKRHTGLTLLSLIATLSLLTASAAAGTTPLDTASSREQAAPRAQPAPTGTAEIEPGPGPPPATVRKDLTTVGKKTDSPTGRLFSDDSTLNTPIPANPVLDPNSAEWAGYIGSSGNNQATLLHGDGIPIFDADDTTPSSPVTVTMNWGPHPTSAPIPPGATPSPSSDASMVVIDWSTRQHYDFWQASRTESGWTASWLSTGSIDDSGIPGGNVGAGVSRLVGVVRTSEITAGQIDHALVFAAPFAGRAFRYPATKSDGTNLGGYAVPMPEGARIQLDPGVDVDSLPGITPGEKTVAKALQTYGAFLVDNGRYEAMGFSFESPHDGQPDPYPTAGLTDYGGMPHIPWNLVRVLRTHDGQ